MGDTTEAPPSRVGLGLVLAVAAALRFWALGHGIPFAVGADEPHIMERVVGMMKTGDLNPHFFDYPGFYIHVQLALACVRFLAGAGSGLWSSLDAVRPTDFYLWARTLSALVGTATVWLVYLVGLRWGAGHALLAAALMAVIPPHVRESHYVLTDVPLTFFTALTMLLALRAHERPAPRAFAWAGVAAGLAAASKYPGIIALALPMVAAVSTRDSGLSPLRAAFLVAGCAVATFLVAAPYTWLDLPGFLNGYAALVAHYPAAAMASWRVYVIHLRLALGWPGFLLMFAGLAITLAQAVRGPARTRSWCLLAFGAAFFYVIASRSLVYGRYLLPLYPVVAVFVATAVMAGIGFLRRLGERRWVRRPLAAGLAMAVLVPPAVGSARFDRLISLESTQSLAYAWFLERVPATTRIALEGQALWLPADRFQVTHVRRLADKPLDAFRADGYEYLVASSEVYGAVLAAPERFPGEYAAYQRLFEELRPLVVFKQSRRHPGPQLQVFWLARPAGVGR